MHPDSKTKEQEYDVLKKIDLEQQKQLLNFFNGMHILILLTER